MSYRGEAGINLEIRRRISILASLALFLSLLTTLFFETTAPQKSEAAETFQSVRYNYSTSVQRWTPPTGTTLVRLILIGGGGGYGGLDCGAGCSYVPPSRAGYVVTGWFSPPSYIDLAPGSAGGGGANCARWGGGGAAGSNPYGYNGGWGGHAGGSGCSGGGGGGGAASVANIPGAGGGLIIAGGAGGGGGNGNFGYFSWMVGGDTPNQNIGSVIGTNGGNPGGSDGGGGGGGGGGRWGSFGGGVSWTGGEFGGIGGRRGSNGWTTTGYGIATESFTWNGNSNGYIDVQFYRASVPGAPGTPSVTPANGSVNLSWSAPTDTGGSGVAITNYEWSYLPSGGAWTVCGTGNTTSTTCSGLTNGTSYQFRVRALNLMGWGGYSNTSAAVVPRTIPSTISSISTTPGNGQVATSWTAPNSNGSSITSYTAQYSIATGSSRNWITASTAVASNSYTYTGLNNGTPYVFRAWAVNAAGAGSASPESAATIPRTNPTAPLSLGVSAVGDGFVTLSWQPPSSNGGFEITDYKVDVSTNAATWTAFNDSTSATTNLTVGSLINGTNYYFRIRSVNSVGLESAVSIGSVIGRPITIPGAPTSLTTVLPNCVEGSPNQACSGRVDISWSSPTNNGGASVSSYTVQAAVNEATPIWATIYTGSASATSINATGLNNGTAYIFRVSATTSAGQGSFTLASSALTPRTTPGSPANVRVTSSGNQQVTLSWSAPANNGGTALTDYRIGYRISGSGSAFTTFSDGVSTETTATVTGLTNGQSYEFQVTAGNSAGFGSPTISTDTGTPLTVPSKAVIASITEGIGELTVALTAGSTGGSPIVSYQYSLNGGTSWITAGSSAVNSSNFVITGLTNGNTYNVTIRAVNIVGAGTASDAVSASPYAAPDAPRELRVTTQGNQQLSIAWNAPSSNGGRALTNYIIQYAAGSGATWVSAGSVAGTTLLTTISGLTNGTNYYLRVFAKNARGESATSSNEVSGIPRTTSGAPTSVTAVRGNAQITVSWLAPTSNGGTAITGYNVIYTGSGGSPVVYFSSGTGTSAVLTDLVNGTSYSIKVRAITEAGAGAESSEVNATPATVPSVPQSFNVTRGYENASLSWSAPASNGGNASISYQYQYKTSAAPTWPDSSISTSSTSITVGSLTAGTNYQFRVRAVNDVGPSSWVEFASAISPYTKASAPVITGVSESPNKVDVTFTASTSDGGTPITGYKIYTYLASDSSLDSRTCTISSSSSSITCSVTGLTNQVEYKFRVVAINAAGESAFSAYSSTATPGALAQTITVGSVASMTFGDKALALNAKASSGLAVSYAVGSSSSGCSLVGTTDTEKAAWGLVSADSAGTCRIIVSQGGGSSFVAAPSVTVEFPIYSIKPTAPRILSVTSSAAGKLNVVLSAPNSNGGAPITGYRIIATGSTTYSADLTSGSLSYEFSGLGIGGYSLVAHAFNVTLNGSTVTTAGSPASTAVSGTVYGTPGAPTLNTVATGDKSLTVTWSAGSTGGLSLTGFAAYAATSAGGTSVASCSTAGSETSCTIVGLNQDTEYFVTVKQSHLYATSAASNEIAQTTGNLSQTIPLNGLTLSKTSGGTIAINENSGTLTAQSEFASGNLQLRAITTAGLDATYATTSSTCSVNSNTGIISISSAGTCVITATQSGTGNAYGSVSRSITITITASQPSPPVITSISKTGIAGQVLVKWNTPTNTGGASITSYTITRTTSGTPASITFSPQTQTTLTDIPLGESTYTLTVSNGSLSSELSNIVSFTMTEKPGAPTNLATITGDKSISVQFRAPLSDGGTSIQRYVVSAGSGANSASCTVSGLGISAGSAASCVLTGLANDSQYAISVVANNGDFNSDALTGTAYAGEISQSLSISSGSSLTKAFGSASFLTTATSNSGLTPTYQSSNTSVCEINSSSGLTTLVGIGDCVVTATFAGTGNAFSSGSVSQTITVTQVAPGPASINKIELSGTDLTVSFNPPTLFGGVSSGSATYTATLDGGTPVICSSSLCTFSGVSFSAGSTSRTISISVITSTGATYSSTATKSATIYKPDPTNPRAVSATGGTDGTSATITWKSPENAGLLASGSAAVITKYEVIVYESGNAVVSSGSITSITAGGDASEPIVANAIGYSYQFSSGLTAGRTYDIVVVAINDAGASSQFGTTLVTPNLAGVPIGLSAVASGTTVLLSWKAPDSDGGSAITSYSIQYKINSESGWQSASSSTNSLSLTNLTPSQTYQFKIASTNGVGTSAFSSEVTAIPYSQPTPPRDVTASSVNTPVGGVTINWTLSESDGGSAIQRYRIQIRSGGSVVRECVLGAASLATGSAQSCAFLEIPRGTYSAAVYAENQTLSSGSASTALDFEIGQSQLVEFTTSTGSVLSKVGSNFTLDKVYGSLAFDLYSVSTSGATPTYTLDSSSTAYCSLSGTRVTLINYSAQSGSVVCRIQASVNADSIFNSASATLDITISPKAPSKVLNLISTLEPSAVKLEWSNPSDLGGGVITDHIIEYRTTGSATWTEFDAGVLTTNTVTVGSLTSGTEYEFRVKAVNAGGTGQVSDLLTRTPISVPNAPTSVNVAIDTNVPGKFDVTWSASEPPANDSYTVYVKTSSGVVVSSCIVLGTATKSCTFTGISRGNYKVEVTATNSVGSSTSTPQVDAVVGLGQTLTFQNTLVGTPPTLLLKYGAAKTKILVTNSRGIAPTLSVISGSPYCSISGTELSILSFSLAAGSTAASCVIRATAAETSLFLASTADLPVTIEVVKPDSPDPVQLIPLDSSVRIQWTTPISDGGSAITKYLVEYTRLFTDNDLTKPNFDFSSGSAVSASTKGQIYIAAGSAAFVNRDYTVTGLLNGRPYAVRVAAINGADLLGEWDPIATPSGLPLPVRHPTLSSGSATVTVGDRQITVSWRAPIDEEGDNGYLGDGGSPITGYEAWAVQSGTKYSCAVAPNPSNLNAVLSCTITLPVNRTAATVSIGVANRNGETRTTLGDFTPIANQVISVTAPSTLSAQFNYGENYQINAGASSGLTLTYSASTTSSVCSVNSSGLVTALTQGTCTITLSQSGNDTFEAAENVTLTLTINPVINPSSPSVSQISTTGASLSATLAWGGININAQFKVCTNESLTTGCILFPNSPIQVTSSSTGTLTAVASGLTPNLQYYLAVIATPTSGSAVESTKSNFTTLSTPEISSTLTNPVVSASYSFTLEASPTSGTGSFSKWEISVGSLPAGLSLASDTGVISGTPTAIGTSTFTVRVTDTGGNTGTKEFTLNVQRTSQNLSIAGIANRPYSTSTVSISASAVAGAVFSYTSNTTSSCTVNSSGVITLVSAGTCTVTVSSPEFDIYSSASGSVSFTIDLASQTISFPDVSDKTYSVSGTFDVSANSSSGLTVSFESLSTSICTVSATTITIVGAGTCNIRATQVPTGSDATKFAPAIAVDKSITINKAAASIGFTGPTTIAYNDIESVVATIAGGGALTLTSGDVTLLEIIDTDKIKAKSGVGTVTLTLNAASSDNYLAGTRNVTVTLNKKSQSISSGSLATRAYVPDQQIPLSSTATSGLAVTYSSSDTSVAVIEQISGSYYAVVKGAGTTVITVDQSGNDTQYLSAPQSSISLEITQAVQEISVTGLPSSPKFGDSASALSTTNTNSRSVSLASQTLDVCTLDASNNLAIVGVGTCTLVASNLGDANYQSKTETYTMTVNKGVRTATVTTSPALSAGTLNLTFGSSTATILVTASADDDDTKTYVVQSGPCSITSGTISTTGAGTCIIRSTVEAGTRYLSASSDITVEVAKASQSITNVIRGKDKVFVKAPDLPTGAKEFRVSSTSTLGDSTVNDTTVVAILEVIMTDPAALPLDDIELKATANGKVTNVLAIGTRINPDANVVTIDKDRSSNEVVAILTPGLPEGATSFTIATNKTVGNTVQVGDVVATLTPVGTGTFTPVEVVTTRAGRVTAITAVGTSGLNQGDSVLEIEPAMKIGEKKAIVATKGAGTGNLTFTSQTTSICSIALSDYGWYEITGVDLGTCQIKIEQASDANYNATSYTDEILVDRGDQSISVSTVESIKLSDAPAAITANAAAGASITIFSNNEEVAEIQNNRIIPRSVGTITLEISAGATTRFNAAIPVTRSVVVEKGDQTIAFDLQETAKVGEEIPLKGSATSKLALTYISSTPDVCVVTGNIVKIGKPGECIIAASQAGNDLWNEAATSSKTLQVKAVEGVIQGPGFTPEQRAAAEAAWKEFEAAQKAKEAEKEAAKKLQIEREEARQKAIKAAQELEDLRASRTQIAEPVKTAQGELPRPLPGNFITANEFRNISNTVIYSGVGTVSINSGGTTLKLFVNDNKGSEKPLRSDKNFDILERDSIAVKGTGFKPNSIINAWVFSTPTLIGKATINFDGSYATNFEFPDSIKAGTHTLQINGIAADGRIRSLTVGIEILPRPVIIEPEPEKPIAKPTTITRTVLFAKGSSRLDTVEKKLLNSLKRQVRLGESVTCTAIGMSKKLSRSELNLAKARATSACKYLAAGTQVITNIKVSRTNPGLAPSRNTSQKPFAVQISFSVPKR